MCRAPYADLSGIGATHASGHWHTKDPDAALLYCADHPSSAILEALVGHLCDVPAVPSDLVLMEIEIADGISWHSAGELGAEWTTRADETRTVGDAWWRGNQSAILRVPSRLGPSWNYLVNTTHPDLRDTQRLRIVSISALTNRIGAALATLRTLQSRA